MSAGDRSEFTQPDAEIAEAHELHRVLGPVHLTMIGIGCIIGAGIFVITGTAAAEHAGPAVLISFVIAALGCLFAGLCYAEFAAMIPESGSAYTYAYATMGRFMAWFIGWNLVLEYMVSASTVAVGWAGYFASFLSDFGIHLPDRFMNAPLEGKGLGDMHLTGAVFNFPAVALILLLTAFLVVGVKQSATFNGAMVLLKTGIVIIVIAVGLPYVHAEHLTPFIPPNEGPGRFGWSGIFTASGVIFFSYIGFDSVSVAAQEAKNPQRDIPIGILASLGICTVLYMLMALVLVGVTDWRSLDVPNPVSFAIGQIGTHLRWLVPLVNIGAIVGLASVVFVSLYGQSRVFFSMARDGFIWKMFCNVHPRFRTPHLGTILIGAFAAVLAAIFPLDILADLVSIGTLMAFVAVCIGIMMLRVSAPNAARPFKTPMVWVVAPLGVLICGFMMISLGWGTWIRLVVWTLAGLAIYFLYGQKHAAPSKWKVR
ncbi:MAG TPA: amino acid permease [Rhizomicrobium sp.]|nr:amino acid permease [Rhizomicrobium sp.]